MSSKDYRELQLSSSQLVIIFLAIIILGVIIFLLGISVGKKRTEIILATQTGTKPASEVVTEEKTVPIENRDAEITESSSPQQKKSAPSTSAQNLDWFIQVGAFNNRQGAQATAEKLREEGLNVIVLDPYASDRKTVFRVRIGGYATKELAEQAKAELVRKDPKAADYFIIRQR